MELSTPTDEQGDEVVEKTDPQSEAAEWKRRYELVIAASGQLVYEYDLASGEILWGGSLDRVLGYSPEEMSGGLDQWTARIHPDDRKEALQLLDEAERQLSAYEVDYRFMHRDGEYRWIHDRGYFLKTEAGDRVLMIGMMQDITRRRELELELERQARTDSLTGALNRRQFLAVAEQELARSLRYNHRLAVLMVDIDRFKEVNDSHGHHAGDMTLQRLVELCWDNLRHVDSVGRLGGEEFAILLPETDPSQAMEIAERLRSAVDRSVLPLDSGVLLRFTISVGVAAYKGDGDMYGLMRRADFALYEAKRQGKNRVCAG